MSPLPSPWIHGTRGADHDRRDVPAGPGHARVLDGIRQDLAGVADRDWTGEVSTAQRSGDGTRAARIRRSSATGNAGGPMATGTAAVATARTTGAASSSCSLYWNR